MKRVFVSLIIVILLFLYLNQIFIVQNSFGNQTDGKKIYRRIRQNSEELIPISRGPVKALGIRIEPHGEFNFFHTWFCGLSGYSATVNLTIHERTDGRTFIAFQEYLEDPSEGTYVPIHAIKLKSKNEPFNVYGYFQKAKDNGAEVMYFVVSAKVLEAMAKNRSLFRIFKAPMPTRYDITKGDILKPINPVPAPDAPYLPGHEYVEFISVDTAWEMGYTLP